ncbi:MAG: ferrous iron transport protein A [Candidatus Methylomirabilis sp.]|nr:ferrous iron transport protein A [Deltaproteobacteria bacterium]
MRRAESEDKTLADLRVGQTATVLAVEGRDESLIRLMEMGLIKGTRVRLERIAPLGDPLYLALRGYCLSIRKSEARRIRVSAVTNGRGPA